MKGKLEMDKAKKINDRLYSKSLETREKVLLYKEYISLLRKAAYKGNSEAQFELGQQYEDINYWGENQNHNPRKCLYWYTKACEKNHAEACNSLAHLYEVGEGINKNVNKALRYYKKSADLGSEIGRDNYKLLLQEINLKNKKGATS